MKNNSYKNTTANFKHTSMLAFCKQYGFSPMKKHIEIINSQVTGEKLCLIVEINIFPKKYRYYISAMFDYIGNTKVLDMRTAKCEQLF